MKTSKFTPIRRTVISTLTALAVALPGTGTAGLFDKAKTRVQSTKANVSRTVSKVQQDRPIVSAFQSAGQKLPDLDLIKQVQALEPLEQFRNTKKMLDQIQLDYQYFSGGAGCAAECGTFRMDLKAVLNDYLQLASEVPALNANSRLSETLSRTNDLIDYIPPRALYLMWQAIGSRLDDLQSVPNQIRRILTALPPIEDIPDIMVGYVDTASEQVADSRMCEWAGADKPFIDLSQAKLEQLAWVINTIEGFIPDIEMEGEAGVEAGVAVGMVTGSVAVTVKPTDSVKSALKVMAVVPEAVNWMIKINVLRAKAVCAGAQFASRIE